MTLVEAFALALHAALPVDPFGGIPVAALDNIGTVALVVLLGIAVSRGWLVTRREADSYLHDRDQWRAESRIKDQRIETLLEAGREKDMQLREVSEVGETVTAIMRALEDRSRAS